MTCHVTTCIRHSLSAFGRFLWRKHSERLVALLLPVKKQILLLHSKHLLLPATKKRDYSHTRIVIPYSVNTSSIGILKAERVCDTGGNADTHDLCNGKLQA